MARRVDRRRVAEAALFGAYQRLIDLEYRSDLSPHQRSLHRGEADRRIVQLEEKVARLGGDPGSVRLRVQNRELELRSRYSTAADEPDFDQPEPPPCHPTPNRPGSPPPGDGRPPTA